MTTRDRERSHEEFLAIGRRLDALIQEFETLPFPQVREQVFELLQTVDALHRVGLGRLIVLLQDYDDGAFFTRAAADPVVRLLLTLYDLIDEPALPAAPAPPAPAATHFIPLTQITRAPKATSEPPVFSDVARLEEVTPGTMMEVTIAGERALLANVAGEVYAVGGVCPGSMAPLALGTFTPPVVVCPWHNEAFDVRTGQRVDGQAQPVLRVLPVAIRDGAIAIAFPAGGPL